MRAPYPLGTGPYREPGLIVSGARIPQRLVCLLVQGDVDAATKRWILILCCLSQFMVILDVAIVNVALPSIKSDLGFSTTGLQWVISAYAIFFGGLLLLGGRLADLLGRRRLFVAGLLVFAASSLLCGLAWSAPTLVGTNSSSRVRNG